MKVFLHKCLRVILILVLSIITGYLLLMGAYSIPTGRMEQHLEASANVFLSEGAYPEVILGYKDSRLDNWTDALMLLTAVYEDGSPAYIASLKNTRPIIDGKSTAECLTSIYADHEQNGIGHYDYKRYWHGYLVLLKPLLYLMRYSSIRYLNMIVQLFLFTWVVAVLSSQKRTKLIFPIFIAWLFMNPVSTILSMQFTAVTVLMLVQLLLFLLLEKRYVDSPFLVVEHFLIAGCMTSYFDLLTFPLVSVGIPLVFWCFLHSRGSVRKNVLFVIGHTAVWGIGYSVMWAGKWVMGSIVLKQNVLMDVVEQAAVRTGSLVREQVISYGDIMYSLWDASNIRIIAFGGIVLAGCLCWGMIHKSLYIKAEFIAVCAIVGTFPFVWYAILKNHSYMHMWFCYRELAVTIFAAAMLGMVSIDFNKLEVRWKKGF